MIMKQKTFTFKKPKPKKPKLPKVNRFVYMIPTGPVGMAKRLAPLRFVPVTVGLPAHSINGSSIIGWQNIIKEGGNATSPLTAQFINREWTPAWYVAAGSVAATRPDGMYPDYYKSQNYRELGYSALPDIGFLDYPSKEADRARSIAAMKFSSKVRDRIMTVSGPTALGEIRETLEMVRRPGKAIYALHKKYMRRVSRRIKKSPRPNGRRAAEKWHKWFVDAYLSFTYGVQPLMADVQGGIDALKNLSQVPSLDVRTRASGNTLADAFTTRSGPYTYNHRRFAKCSCEIVGVIRGDIFAPVDSLSRLQQLLGFSWAEAVPTIYNLLPFSFIVDYFSNLNEVVSEAYGSSAYVAWASSSTRTRLTVDTNVRSNYVFVAPSPGYEGYRYSVRTVNAPGKGLYKQTNVSRVDGVPPIKFAFDFPSPKQIVNMAALVSSLTKLERLYRG